MSSKLTKSEKTKSKFTQLNINHVYKGNTSETHHKPAVRQYGMQVVGKLQGTRRLPPPAWVPSLKAETGGLDPRVSLVPAGGSGWGAPYSGISSSDPDPAQASNELPTTLDSVANSPTYSSMNGALREAIGTSFEPAFARQSFAYAAKLNTEPAGTAVGTPKETMASTVAKGKSDTLTAVEDNQVTVLSATSEAQLPSCSQRSQSTAASGGLAANRPFFQRPTPITTSTVPSKTSVDSLAVSGVPASAKGTCGKVSDWASVPNGEEPNYDEKLLFSDEDAFPEESQDAAVATQAVSGRESTQKDIGQGVSSSAAISTGTSTWASSVLPGSNVTDHSGMMADTRLFPSVPPDTWQSDPTTLVESVHCPSLPGHLSFVPPPPSITGTSISHEAGSCIPLEGHYLSSASSLHVQPPYKDPYFPQTISSRLMETSISSRMPDNGLVTGDPEVELQNFQRQARTKEFKSAVERAQHARTARQKPDAFLSDQSSHQALRTCGVNVSDPSIDFKYCQPVSVPLQATANLVPRETGPNVGPLLNNSMTTPHLLLSAYQQAAAAAMALSSGNSAPTRFPYSHLLAPTTGSSPSSTCTGGNSQWSGPLNSNITSGANQPSLLSSRAQHSILDTFSAAANGSTASTSQMSAPGSHPPAILLNPEFFVERFWEIFNQQQAPRPSQQPTEQPNRTMHEGGSEISQPLGTATGSEDILGGSQQQPQYDSKCNGSLILGDYGFRADHFASACIEDASPQADAIHKTTRFVTPSPDADSLSATVSDAVTVRNVPQSDQDRSSSKLSKRVPGLMDVKVPKSTACSLAHLWDQDNYLIPSSRTVGSRGRGRQTIVERGRGSAGRRRGTFRQNTVDTKLNDSVASPQSAQITCTAPSDYSLDNNERDGEIKQQAIVRDAKTDLVHTDGSESGEAGEADDSSNVVEASKSATPSIRRGSNKKRASDQPGDTRIVDGSRRFRGRGDSHYYLHDSGYNYYDSYSSGSRAGHRGSSSHFTTHRSFSNRDTTGSYSTRFIRQFGGGSFSSRDYRQHAPVPTDQHTALKPGQSAQGYKDGCCTRGEPLSVKQSEQSDQPRRTFTNQRKQRSNGTPGSVDYHFSDSEDPHHYRRNRDLHEPTSIPPRNRSHEGPRFDLSKNSDRKKTQTADADESSKSGPLVANITCRCQNPKETRPSTKDTHLLDYDDADIPTVRVPASDTRTVNTYRQQYPFSRSGGFRSGAYNRRGGKTAPNGQRAAGRTNPQQSNKQAGATGNFPSSRRYRELRDRHRDDGRDGDGGGAAAGGGNSSGAGNGTTNASTGGGGGHGKSGHTVPSGGVGGPKDDNAPPNQGHSLDLCRDEEVGNSNESNAQVDAVIQPSAYASDNERLTTGNRSLRSSNHSTSEGRGGHHRVLRHQRHRFHPEMIDSYRPVYSSQKRTNTVRSQNIPPLMSIKPTGPFSCNPHHFDAVLDLGCSRNSKTEVTLVADSPQTDGASVKSEDSSSGREPTDQETVNGDNCRAGVDDCEDDRGSFLSDGFMEVVSKASKRLARLRLQQETAAAATATTGKPGNRYPGEVNKQSSHKLSLHNSRSATNQRHQDRPPGVVKATNAIRNTKKKSASISASVATKYTTQRSSTLQNIKATFMGPPLSSLISEAPSNSGTDPSVGDDHGVPEAPIQVNESGFTVWTSPNQHNQTVVTTAVAQEPRTWSKVVGTKSSSGSSTALATDLKHATVGSKKSTNGISSLPHDAMREAAVSYACNKDASSVMQDKTSSTPASRRSDEYDSETQKLKSEQSEKSALVAMETRQVCTVSATSVYPSVSSTTVVSGPSSSCKVLSTAPPSVSHNSTGLTTVVPNPVVVVVPVSSNNICKVRPQQQQRSSTHDSVPITATSSAALHHSQSSQSSATASTNTTVANVSSGASEVATLNASASLVSTGAVCHDMDRDYVDLTLSVVGGGGGANPTQTQHEQVTHHSGWSNDGSASVATSNSSSSYYNKFAGSQHSVEPGTVARSFWPISEQHAQLGDAANQPCTRPDVGGQAGQFSVHPPPDHAAMGLLPTGVSDYTGNKNNGLPSALHSLYPLQVNFTGQSIPAPAMDSYNSTNTAAAYAGGTASTFNDFACKVPPSHVGSPTQQQHPALGNNSVYIAPPLLHSSVTIGGASQQGHSTYPASTTNWTALSINHTHPSQQTLLHSRQQRVRHRPTPNNAVESPAPFSGFPYHPDAQNDYAFLQSGIPPAPNSGLYSSVPTHPHSVYVPPTSRSWSLLGAPAAGVGASVMRNQDYHPGMTAPSFAGSGNGGGGGGNGSGNASGGGGAVGLLPHPLPPGGGGRASTDYAPYVGQTCAVSSSANVGFPASSLVNNYVGVIGGGRPASANTTADLGRADHLALSLRHRGGPGGQQGFFQPLHAVGASNIAGMTDSSSTHNNQLAAPQQQFPVHSSFYTSSSQQQQQHRLQQQLSQFAVGGQSAVARATVNSVAHHGLVGGPPAATGLYATYGTPPPNQPTPPPLPAHPGPAQIAPTALRHGAENWHWWG